MNLELITLSGVKYKADAYSVVLPTAGGEITVLPGHEPLLAALVPGAISIRKHKDDTELDHYATYGGVVEVSPERTRVLVDEADNDDEINQAEAEKAHEAALKLLAEAKTHVELEHAQALVDRQAVRIKVSDLKRRHRAGR
ncbi:MAG TPA: ATP synthase F1 subunit epsilon [Candidatus Limnocylindrales bacterium]|nr:ATP synthase F1 subunit epsilon [Candidatus Limnocylindrales bacterium]